eukprot:3251432-Prymnesium_polylepis.1
MKAFFGSISKREADAQAAAQLSALKPPAAMPAKKPQTGQQRMAQMREPRCAPKNRKRSDPRMLLQSRQLSRDGRRYIER